MLVTLTITSYQSQSLGDKTAHSFSQSGGTFGRSPDNQWVLPDPERIISSHHGQITFRDGCFYLIDTSTNGIFIGEALTPIGKGNSVLLNPGERLKFGEYDLQVSLPQADSAPAPFADGSENLEDSSINAPNFDPMGGVSVASEPIGDDFDNDWASVSNHTSADSDPFIAPNVEFKEQAPQAYVAKSEPAKPIELAAAQTIPDNWDDTDFDLLPSSNPIQEKIPVVESAGLNSESLNSESQAPQIQSNPSFDDPFELSPSVTSQQIPEPLQEQLDKQAEDDLFAVSAVAKPSESIDVVNKGRESNVAQTQSNAFKQPPLNKQPSILPQEEDQDPFAIPTPHHSTLPISEVAKAQDTQPTKEPTAPQSAASQQTEPLEFVKQTKQPSPMPEAAATQREFELSNNSEKEPRLEPKPEFNPPQAPDPVSDPTPAAAPIAIKPESTHSHNHQQNPVNNDLYQQFLSAAGIDPAHLADLDPATAMHDFGGLFRDMLQGLIELQQARSQLKNEFRMSLTTIRPIENNPLKFAPNVDEAMRILFLNKGGGYLDSNEAIKESVAEVRSHQIAMISGMQSAFMDLMDRMSPDNFVDDGANKSALGNAMRSMTKKSDAWAKYNDFYKYQVDDADNAFQVLFGESFSKAYEEQIEHISKALKQQGN